MAWRGGLEYLLESCRALEPEETCHLASQFQNQGWEDVKLPLLPVEGDPLAAC